ncbi:hypothetical protein DRQ25_03565 [Candidatus Fermentibacteria bacterium]|nr:MAG: hypothetical protein DRQ25_03565 [Candidatus Fermentibacteria bacterium]
MRRFRNILKILLFSSILVWTLGFLLGKGTSLTWNLASLAVYLAPISGVILLVMLLTGVGATHEEKRRRAGETLKCIKCGRPSIPGSQYCRYHHDIMSEEQGPSAR